jgi:glycosyltransferase involved in cell wall biosynthesis
MGAAGLPLPTELEQLAPVIIMQGGQSSDEGAMSRHHMRLLYQAAHVFVLPTRGEGWGLPMVEAMSMSLPVIATNFSGPTAYMTEDKAFPLSYELLEGSGMAEPSRDHLVQLLLFVYNNRDEALGKARRGRAYVSSTLTPKAVSELMLQRIRQHMRFPHPRMQGSDESTLERAPRETMHSAEARAKSHREL